MSEYTKQAETFAVKYNVTMTPIYKGHYARFFDHVTAVYSVTLERPGKKPYMFDFSTSINDSWEYRDINGRHEWKYTKGLPPKMDYKKFFANNCQTKQDVRQRKTPPTLYDVLACLTKYDPETFEIFCSDYGYDEDSRKALETFNLIDKEWHEVKRMFSDCLDELQEIV